MNAIPSRPTAVKFSVVIPCYNRATTVRDTLLSVQAQTYANFECIVVDDGSSDSTLLQSLIESLEDERFVYVWRENGGGGAARNTGIDVASGDFVAFLDSDDYFVPHKLERFAGIVSADKNRGYYSKVSADRGAGRLWPRPDRAIGAEEDMGEYLFVFNQFIQTSTIVIATDTARSVRFDPSLRKGQDLDFCVRLHHAGVRFEMIDECLSVWTDQSELNRTSRHPGYAAPIAWLERNGHLLSTRAQLGYRATVLAYYLAKERPFTALRDLAAGLFRAGVPPLIVARQFLRCFVPRDLYRRLVDTFVAYASPMRRR